MGLDHYVVGEYERAIGVWTRVIFLDRHHDRALAYIDRARRALAERHRKSEELLHDGVSAYNAGEIEKARDLLTRAVEQGSDAADVFLSRLSRVGSTAAGPESRVDLLISRGHASMDRVARATGGGWGMVGLIAAVAAASLFVTGLPIGAWLYRSQTGPQLPGTTVSPQVEPVPVVRAPDVLIDSARAALARGERLEALRLLDGVPPADALRAEADALRAELQRELLAAAGLSDTPAAARPMAR